VIEIRVDLALGAKSLAVRCSLTKRVTAIVGRSGAGKTSLLESIAGLRKRASGRVAIDGHVVLDSGAGIDLPPERRRIGYVPQDTALFPHLTARANVLFGGGDSARFAQLCRTFELEPLLDQRPATLSGGERQRVALARALMTDPQLLLLDEPLAAVDQPLRERVLMYLRRVRDTAGIPMIYVTHQPFEAQALAHDCLLLEDGRVVAQGAPDAILHGSSQFGGVDNVLEVTDPRHDSERGITRVTAAGGLTLTLPYDQVRDAAFPLVVRIGAEEIVVFGAPPSAISSRNVIAGSIRELRMAGGVVDIMVATPTPLYIRLTADATDDLHLSVGKQVWLALRSRAFRIVG
jgi:molybdate transport system ATP-binding protein